MFGPFPASFSKVFFINFLTQFNIISQSSVLLSCCHIYTIDDFPNYGTLLCPELERLTLPESTDGGSQVIQLTEIADVHDGVEPVANVIKLFFLRHQ
jgi:hypothetical protein